MRKVHLAVAIEGMDALAVGYGYSPPGELESSGAKYFAKTVEEARAVLRALL